MLHVADVERLLAGIEGATVAEERLGVVARVGRGEAEEALGRLKEAGLDSLVDLLGTDTGEHIEITYHLRSYEAGQDVFVKTAVPYDGELASVWQTCPAALMPERETAELFGLRLTNHPNPKRLLTTEGVPPLLRKDVPVRSPEEFTR
ncbi:NADH-quinone oxidoreductase subunit C [Coriobacteriia bacterium Es71-Z0120]|uniref:NADH-quinone oxidoreductase subunit C n=1 Tax=Parvivirga hydrogeniphila TaxID=2939460 RepID=UPI002260E26A|nr:NADH-quinone oxidoreductase subunit C [Parvivirga hydrogeniphila]MCL4079294.1 NADH-quinone oxidoreductase subunit C [Parvivirga hydrogeniphila]